MNKIKVGRTDECIWDRWFEIWCSEDPRISVVGEIRVNEDLQALF